MTKINLENQLRSLYEKARQKQMPATAATELGSFSHTLKHTIDEVQELSSEADSALKGLSQDQKSLQDEIAQADSIHRRIMEMQNNLTHLYTKVKTKQN